MATQVKGNGNLYTLTDADEYDRCTGGWFSTHFPETYRLQKAYHESHSGLSHPQFKALKDMALALGKALQSETLILESMIKTDREPIPKVPRIDSLRKAIDLRREQWENEP